MLKEIISVLVIIFLVLAISIFFFDYNPISKVKEKIVDIKYERSLNKTIVDNQTLIVDDPKLFPYDRFKGITLDKISYEEGKDTDFLVASFTDDSGYLNNKCFELYRMSFSGNFPICNSECSNKTTGKLYCDIYDYLHNPEKGILIGSLKAYGGGEFDTIESTNQLNEELVDMIMENAEKRCADGFEDYCVE